MYLIPIMKRIIHPFYRVYLAETAQQRLHLSLLFFQLFFIRNIQILAASASARNWTKTVFSDCSYFRLCRLSSSPFLGLSWRPGSFWLPGLSSSPLLARLPGLSWHPGFFRLYHLAFSFAIPFKISVFSFVCHI